MIKVSINVTKIPREKLVKGQKGTYFDAILVEKPSEYGDGFVAMSVSKEERERGVKGEIIGNWKTLGQSKRVPVAQSLPPGTHAKGGIKDDLDAFEDVPF